MVKGISATCVGVCMLLLVGCGAGDNKSETVSVTEYGQNWPFVVDSVDLMCEGPSPKALARTGEGTIYALSGSARSHAKERGWADGQDITKPNPTMPMIKMDYSDIVKRAQSLCDK